jgi:hypothetical protein
LGIANQRGGTVCCRYWTSSGILDTSRYQKSEEGSLKSLHLSLFLKPAFRRVIIPLQKRISWSKSVQTDIYIIGTVNVIHLQECCCSVSQI